MTTKKSNRQQNDQKERGSDFAKEFYGSPAWQSLREHIKKRDAYLCQDCLAKGLHTPAEEVHHIKPITPANINNPEITLNEKNLVSLCRECHRARHGARDRRYTVDAFGRVTIKK